MIQILSKIEKLLLAIIENAILVHFLAFLFGMLLIILSYFVITPTLISFRIFSYIVIGIILLSIILTLFNFRFNSFIKKLWLIKPIETFLYFGMLLLIFFSLNYYFSFDTKKEYNYEIYRSKDRNSIFGHKRYTFSIAEDTWHDWSSSARIHVDSSRYYHSGDFIDVRINRGLFGFEVVPKNQIK